ncbi:MAG: PIG-L deacetylase family protein [Candidatus Limnocylindria bacterium]
MPLRLATILAHPDDETFGVGGTLIRYADEGIECHSLCLTRGEAGQLGDPAVTTRDRLGDLREAELAEAARRMGLSSVTCLRFPDGSLADVPAEVVVREVAGWLRRVGPHVAIVWGPDGGYGHPDHVVAGDRALAAIELAAGERDPELGDPAGVSRCYRMVASADLVDAIGERFSDFSAYMATLSVKPERWTRERLGAVIDVRAYADRKWEAMQAHRSQGQDIARLATIRADPDAQAFFGEETFIRAFPEPGGPPLEHDLFGALRGMGKGRRAG